MRSWQALAVAAGVGMAITSCGDPIGPGTEQLEHATINGAEDLFIPDSVAAGSRYPVVVQTSGDGCWRFGETVVESGAPNQVTITPYNYRWSLEGGFCPAILVLMTHATVLEAPLSGFQEVVVAVRVFDVDTLVHFRDTVMVY